MKTKSFTKGKLIKEAKGLLEPGEELRNREYLRGMCELVASVFPEQNSTTWDAAARVAEEITGKSFRQALKSMYGK